MHWIPILWVVHRLSDCSCEASLDYSGVVFSVHVYMHLCVGHIVYSDTLVVYQY